MISNLIKAMMRQEENKSPCSKESQAQRNTGKGSWDASESSAHGTVALGTMLRQR
jgi:hypothetical protein